MNAMKVGGKNCNCEQSRLPSNMELIKKEKVKSALGMEKEAVIGISMGPCMRGREGAEYK